MSFLPVRNRKPRCENGEAIGLRVYILRAYYRLMEKQVERIVFRRMTHADFFNINKVGGEEEGGGGQSYIDFPQAKVTVADWKQFLGAPTGAGAQGPQWDFNINSFGLGTIKLVRIYQRRPQSVSVGSQKIHGGGANRVPGWHPENGFPTEYDPEENHLVVYLVKTTDGEIWAGWFLQNRIPKGWQTGPELQRLFTETAGLIQPAAALYVETGVKDWPFYFEEGLSDDIDEHLEREDTSNLLDEIADSNLEPEVIERLVKMRKRSARIVTNLKKLYGGNCQISGEMLTFRKKDGELYSEVHHLIPLGESGSDSFANTVVVSPLIHRMLHYAEVEGLDLKNIVDNKLEIKINGESRVIAWHPDHAKVIQESLAD